MDREREYLISTKENKQLKAIIRDLFRIAAFFVDSNYHEDADCDWKKEENQERLHYFGKFDKLETLLRKEKLIS